MTRYALSEWQTELLKEKCVASLKSVARKLSCDPTELANNVLTKIAETAKDQLRFMQSTLETETNDWEEELNQALSSSDIWTVLQALDNHTRFHYLNHLGRSLRYLPIDISYIQLLYSNLNPGEQKDDPYQVALDIVRQIPQLYLFSNEFNAYITGESEIEGVPSICVYHLLLTALQLLAEITSDIMYERTPSHGGRILLVPRTSEEIEKISSNEDYLLSISNALDLLLGQSIEAKYVSSFTYEDAAWLGPLFISYVAIFFVHMHEFGHFFRGHLPRGTSPQIEFEADYFALASIGKYYEAKTEWLTVFYRKCLAPGISLLFVSLEVIELLDDDRKFFPPANIRFQTLLTHFRDTMQRQEFLEYRERYIRIFNPVLYQRFGVSLAQ